MGNNKPLVSILLCSYNAEKFIRSTLDSVLKQSYKNLELLILDNNSRDKTVEIIHSFEKKHKRIKLFLKNKNIGAYPGLNFLLDKAKGVYIAINDHDDIWHPKKLEKQIALLEKNNKYVGCGSAMVNYYEQYKTYLLRQQPEKYFLAWHSSLVFRNTTKRYDINIKVGTDFYFMKNILCANQNLIYNFESPLVLRVIRKGKVNLSKIWLKKSIVFKLINLDIPLFDKFSLLSRLFIPEKIIDFILLKLIYRSRVLGRRSIAQYFGKFFFESFEREGS